MRIGELAEATGVSPRSLRYYESVGLIQATRHERGWRDFDPSTVDRVITIQHLFAAGLSGPTIAELLPCLEAPPERRTSHLAERLVGEIERLEGARREIERELEVLRTLQRDTAIGADG